MGCFVIRPEVRVPTAGFEAAALTMVIFFGSLRADTGARSNRHTGRESARAEGGEHTHTEEGGRRGGRVASRASAAADTIGRPPACLYTIDSWTAGLRVPGAKEGCPFIMVPVTALVSRSALVSARGIAFMTQRRSLCNIPSSSGGGGSSSSRGGFWEWTTQHRPSWKESPLEAAVAFTVFGITGSTSVAVVRPTLKSVFGIEGTMRDGPNSYRVMSVVAVSPIYAAMLVTFGTLAGRHRFFANMSHKIFGRFLPQFVLSRISSAFGYCFPGSLRARVSQK